jgi:hypothetical protein
MSGKLSVIHENHCIFISDSRPCLLVHQDMDYFINLFLGKLNNVISTNSEKTPDKYIYKLYASE